MDAAILVCAVLAAVHGAGMSPLERAALVAHYASCTTVRRIDEASELLRRHGGYAVSTSWGKDSVVLLHLAAAINPTIHIINARYPNPAERFADMDRVRDLVLARDEMQQAVYREVSTPGEWEMYKRAGGGFAEAETAEQREATRWWKQCFTEAMAGALHDIGCDGVFLGLRAEESHARRMNLLVRGDDYARKDGQRIALPLGRWTGKDVWAYLAAHDLPWLRIYDAAHCGRERARSGFVFATGGAGAIRRHGTWEDWRRVYPCEFSAWMRQFPELNA